MRHVAPIEKENDVGSACACAANVTATAVSAAAAKSARPTEAIDVQVAIGDARVESGDEDEHDAIAQIENELGLGRKAKLRCCLTMPPALARLRAR